MTVCFDKNLRLIPNSIFFTVSGYILRKRKIPESSDFQRCEKDMTARITDLFKEPVSGEYNFNAAIAHLICEYRFDIDNCRFTVEKNIDNAVENLHSFFTSDLEAAMNISTPLLDLYLSNEKMKRENLDSKLNSTGYNPRVFYDLLSPDKYPLGRFPSKTKYAPVLMQQIAVNLSIGADSQQIRSVNGPPGTGKTTLLKDIFAELIVRQAVSMCNLPNKKIKGTNDTIYYNKASIGELPNEINENGIVVASSNNGAVKNIVNELPLLSGIDETLRSELLEADYFLSVSSSDDAEDEPEIWGDFSLEGGRKANLDQIVCHLENIIQHLNEEYISDTAVYDEFMKQYSELLDYRSAMQKRAERIVSCLAKYKTCGVGGLKKRRTALISLQEESQKTLQLASQRIEQLKVSAKELYQNKYQLKNTKPSVFNRIKRQQYAEAMEAVDELIRKNISEQSTLFSQAKKAEDKISEYQREADELADIIAEADRYNALDMTVDYDELQQSNPWFDEDFRIRQSKLFICALRVRKQFLYENSKNLKAAVNIWKYQNKHEDNKRLIAAAWHWINLTIPVISSTFASFARMCKNLPPQTLGHLFIDEAGQALPQAAVGAVFRSRHVMAVGDPAQIKPVLTLDPKILTMLSKKYNVSETYISENASVQSRIDSISRYGFYRAPDDPEDNHWIGIPLWVHRRSCSPMFDLSNALSYGGFMVLGKPEKLGRAQWFDVKGKANDKYVEEQGEFLLKMLSDMIEKDPEILTADKDKVYIITPFRNVAAKLARKLREINFTRGKGKPTNIGTVHTFQGREADIVFLVLGADEQSKGAANWSVSEENMMNVAATRAKKEFYIIGDRQLYHSLRTNTTKLTLSIIDDYNRNHPDHAVDAQTCLKTDNCLSGVVARVGKGRTSCYAYVTGSDNKTYTISERVYPHIENADKLIKTGNTIRFTVDEGGKYINFVSNDQGSPT